MSKRWGILLAIVILITVLLLSACPAPATPTTPTTPTTPEPPKEPVTLKLSYSMPKGAAIGAGFERWAEEFPGMVDGRYKVETYPGSTLVGLPAALDSVKSGVAEIVMTSNGMFPKDFPLSLVASLPTLGFPGWSQEGYSKGYDAWWELYNRFPEIQAEFKDFKLVWPFLLDPSYLVTKKKEVHKAADFKGMKIGGTGQVMEIIKANGGAEVHQVPPQAYTNLDKGVIDGSMNTFSQIADYKLYEICNYFYRQDFGSGCLVIAMNQEVWDAMSPEDQKIFDQSWVDAIPYMNDTMIDDNVRGLKEVEDLGYTVTDPTPAEVAAWAKAATPAFDKWKKDCIDLGVSAELADEVFEAWKEIRAKHYPK
jgi:TRAP-type C4-dicarboxylate transport system substrate-binding protein